MYCWSSRLPLSLLVLLSIGGAARADLIVTPPSWTYSWFVPTSVAVSPNGSIGMTPPVVAAGTTLSGSSNINAATLTAFSTASTPEQISNANYSLTITLTDENSQVTRQLTFQGQFSGTLSSQSSGIQNTFLSPTMQTVKLGDNDYSVSLNSFAPPGNPGTGGPGSIGADVTITPATNNGGGGGVQTVPEPSTLLLTGLAVPAGLAWWRTRGMRRREATND